MAKGRIEMGCTIFWQRPYRYQNQLRMPCLVHVLSFCFRGLNDNHWSMFQQLKLEWKCLSHPKKHYHAYVSSPSLVLAGVPTIFQPIINQSNHFVSWDVWGNHGWAVRLGSKSLVQLRGTTSSGEYRPSDTWWLIPLSKWVITPVINGITMDN